MGKDNGNDRGRKADHSRLRASSTPPPYSKKIKTINQDNEDTNNQDNDQQASSSSTADAKRTRLNPVQSAIERLLKVR